MSDLSSSVKVLPGNVGGDTITVDASRRYQVITGFGFALTDTSAYLIDQIPNGNGQRDRLLRQLFDPNKGIGVSWIRIIIGASDFTVVPRPWYSYRPTAADEFDLGRPRVGSPKGDDSHIVPILQKAIRLSKRQLSVFANPHSAPAWMKANNDMWNLGGDGCLLGYCPHSRSDVRDEYAQYFVDFIKEYQARGIQIQAVGVQNEPNSIVNFPGGKLADADQLDFISRLKRRFALQRPSLKQQVWAEIPSWEAAGKVAASTHSGAVDGLSLHCYYGPPVGMNEFHAAFPEKAMGETECTQDSTIKNLWPKTIDLLIRDTRNWANVVASWNLALDPTGGPDAACASPIVGTPDNGTGKTGAPSPPCTTKGSPMTAPVVIDRGAASLTREYYEMGHFSKFVRPGAVRIGSSVLSSVPSVAFQNRDGTKVLVAHNNRDRAVRLGINTDKQAHIGPTTLAPGAIVTYRW